jgi:hypothetical protein
MVKLDLFKQPILQNISLVACGFLLVPVFFLLPFQTHYKLVIDMKVDKGYQLVLYFNNNYGRYFSQTLKLNERAIYSFDNLNEKIEQIRVDPTNVQDASIDIYKLQIFRNDSVILDLTPADMMKWAPFLFVSAPQVVDDHLHMLSTTNTPMAIASLNYNMPMFDKWLLTIGSNAVDLSVTLCLFLVVVLILMGYRSQLEWLYFFPLIFLPLFLKIERLISIQLLDLLQDPLKTGQSIGIASYIGQAKSVESKTFICMIVVAGVSGAVLFFLRNKLEKYFRDWWRPKEKTMPARDSYSPWFLAGALLLLVVCGLQPIKEIFDRLPLQNHAPDWDSQAVLLWQYVYNAGLIPLRDYWFPYGGAWNQISPFPMDLLRLHIHDIIVFGMCIFSVYRLTGYKKLWTLILLAGLLCFAEVNLMKGLFRYLICVDIVLLYLVFAENLQKLLSLVFGIFCGWALTYEPTQLFYASVPILFVFAKKAILEKRNFKHFFGSHVPAIICLLVITVGFILKLYLQEQWPGFLSFYKHIGTMSVSSASPDNLPAWAYVSLQPENIVMVATLFFILWGVYLQLLAGKNCDLSKASDFISVFGLLAFMIFLKHLVRPHMALQFVHVHWIGLILFLSVYSATWSKMQKQMGLIIFGCCLGWGYHSHALTTVFEKYSHQASSFLASLQTVFLDAETLKKQQNAFFAVDLFTKNSVEVKQVFDAVTSENLSARKDDLYVLGDDAFFYILFQKHPPPFVSVYDGGPLYAQQTNLNWLKSHNPSLVIWNSSVASFDGVPNLVRVPLLYEYVMQNFKLHEKIGKYVLLTPLPPGEKPDFVFWLQNLGKTLELGFVPIESNLKNFPPCTEDCYELLQINAKPEALGSPIAVTFSLGDSAVEVKFNTRKNVTQYYLTLDRLWFWSLAKVLGGEVTYKTEPAQVASVEILKRERAQLLLY